MDGIFASVDYSQPMQAAVNDLHTSLHTFLLLVRYKDAAAGVTRSLILCFYKNRWFVANQGSQMLTICSAPIGGIIETFSSSGSDITQIFQSLVPIPIILRTSLSPNQEIQIGKKALVGAVALSSGSLTTMHGTCDSENLNPGIPFQFLTANQIIWQNNAGQTIQWRNNLLQNIAWASTGFVYQRVQLEGSGVFLGLTLTGTFAGQIGGGGTTGASQGLIITALVLEYQDRAVLASKMNA
jgi:hypothetical protein